MVVTPPAMVPKSWTICNYLSFKVRSVYHRTWKTTLTSPHNGSECFPRIYFLIGLCIGNHTVSNSIWNKFARVNFQKCANANLFQIDREKLYDYLLNNINIKNFAWRKCRKIFLKAFLSHLRNCFFQSFLTKVPSSFYAILLA